MTSLPHQPLQQICNNNKAQKRIRRMALAKWLNAIGRKLALAQQSQIK